MDPVCAFCSLGQGCSSQDWSFLLWRAVEKVGRVGTGTGRLMASVRWRSVTPKEFLGIHHSIISGTSELRFVIEWAGAQAAILFRPFGAC